MCLLCLWLRDKRETGTENKKRLGVGWQCCGEKIEKIQKDEGKEEEKFIDVVINKNMKLGQKVLIPVKQFPKFNFVGKLLGPRGNSLKRLQEDTLTKMSILGKGSMRDKEKEEELRQSGEAKYHHLNEDLHVLIEVFAPPAEAYARMGHALEEIKKFLIPLLFGSGQLIFSPSTVMRIQCVILGGKSSRGGVPPLHAAVPRGAAPRGAPPSRAPSSRGRGVQRARGAPPTAGYRPAPPIVQDTYGEYVSPKNKASNNKSTLGPITVHELCMMFLTVKEYDDGYGTAYDDQGYESYDNNYSNQGQNSDDYYEYGHSGESYDSYGQCPNISPAIHHHLFGAKGGEAQMEKHDVMYFCAPECLLVWPAMSNKYDQIILSPRKRQ
ncbi:hypothetical protein PAMP_007746 [Pampus punctatissimus]